MAGGKYAKRNDRESKREAKQEIAAGLAEPSGHGTYVPPNRSACWSDPPVVDALSDTSMFYVFTWFQDSRLVEFLMLHLILLQPGDEGWYILAKADCADGSAHLHEDDEGGPRNVGIIRPLHGVDDVEEAYSEAYDRVYDHWRGREGRFENAYRQGRRKRPTGPLPQTDLPPHCFPEG